MHNIHNQKYKPHDNIIDRITQKKSSEKPSKQLDDNSLTVSLPLLRVTASSFFFDNGSGGYMSKTGFLSHVYSMDTNELIDFEALFDVMNRKIMFDAPAFSRPDFAKRPYLWCSIELKGGTIGFKILTAERLEHLIMLYQVGLIACPLSLTTLYHEAINPSI
jgi:hypothetical protein